MPVVAALSPLRPTVRLESSLRSVLLHKTFYTYASLNYPLQVLKYVIEVGTSARLQQALS
jgi:hypothetical protein